MENSQDTHKRESRFRKWWPIGQEKKDTTRHVESPSIEKPESPSNEKPLSPPTRKPESAATGPGVFGVLLTRSITYANVAISGLNVKGETIPVGHVPIVVAKCGVFLKEQATETKNISKIAGSHDVQEKLRRIFDSSPRYGKGVSWDNLTVDDTVIILVDYLESLPEPVIPLGIFDEFDAVIGKSASPSIELEHVQRSIQSIPQVHRFVFLYLLDAIAVFASKSDEVLVTTEGLSKVFANALFSGQQLSIEQRDTRWTRAASILLYLIENSDHFAAELGFHLPKDSDSADNIAQVATRSISSQGDQADAGPEAVQDDENVRNEDDDGETIISSDHTRSENIGGETVVFGQETAQVNSEKRQHDHDALLDTAGQHVKYDTKLLEERTLQETGRTSLELMTEQQVVAREMPEDELQPMMERRQGRYNILPPTGLQEIGEYSPSLSAEWQIATTRMPEDDLQSAMDRYWMKYDTDDYPATRTDLWDSVQRTPETSSHRSTIEAPGPPTKSLTEKASPEMGPPIITRQDRVAPEQTTMNHSLPSATLNIPARKPRGIPTEPHDQSFSSTINSEGHAQQDDNALQSSEVTNYPDQIEAIFSGHLDTDTIFTEPEISMITSSLQVQHPTWKMTPRLYIILRIIECLGDMNAIVQSGFSDYELPVTERNIPRQLSAEYRSKFLNTQKLVLTPTVSLERRNSGRHHHFGADDPFPFEFCQRLGAGGFGEVDKVRSVTTGKEYALKRYRRRVFSTGKGLVGLRGIIAEIQILKTLSHEHIVKFVGSYTDKKYLGLLMKPVAESDLKVYLSQASPSQYATLRSFFGCLTAGLEYLHRKLIRHKDIKPGNILVHQGRVLLTDFGLARDFTGDGSTTAGTIDGLSARYAAPEVLLMEPRNTKSDIWSLGVVFLEMLVVLKREDKDWLDNYMLSHGDGNTFVRTNRDGFTELVTELEKHGEASDNIVLNWISQMLQEQNALRPTASWLLQQVISPDDVYGPRGTFCGLCCRYEESSSDTESE